MQQTVTCFDFEAIPFGRVMLVTCFEFAACAVRGNSVGAVRSVPPEFALSGRLTRAASPGADERETAAQEVRIIEPGFLRGSHHSRGDQRPCHGCDAEPVE